MTKAELDDIVQHSLSEFAAKSLGDLLWRGRREREAISLYVFRYLLREISPDRFLRDAAQIGIEYPVPQIAGLEASRVSGRRIRKLQVCKDVVIWANPGMTCWDEGERPTIAPAAILEWKFGVAEVCEPDVDWLKDFSLEYPGFVGYAIAANRPGAKFLLACDRVANGEAKRDWLRL